MIDPAVTMIPLIVRTMRTSQGFATRETTIFYGHGPIKAMIDDPDIIGPRLRALRLALGIETQVEFAESIGVEKNTYNPWEKGSRPLTFDGACKIRKKYHIPLDYLFYGESMDELPMKVIKNLRQAA